MLKTLLIIPAFNEEKNLIKVINDIKTNASFADYIIINDGSKDDTIKLCKENNFNVLDLPVNLGLHGAFKAGMMYAYENNYDVAIQFDADGQHLARYCQNLVQAVDDGADIAIGSRTLEKRKVENLRSFGSFLISLALKITTRTYLSDPTSGMRAYSKEYIKFFSENRNLSPEPDTIALLIKKGATVKEILVTMQNREHGSSYLTFARSIKYMLRILISILILQWFI